MSSSSSHFKELPPQQLEKFIEELKKGRKLAKVSSNGKAKDKMVRLTEDGTRLEWESKKKNFAEKTIFLTDIREIRFGQDTDAFVKSKVKDKKELSFSIVYRHLVTVLDSTADFVAPNEDELTRFTHGIEYLRRQQLIDKESNPLKHFLLHEWMKTDKDGDGKLQEKEIRGMIDRINADMSKDAIKKKFKEADKDKSGYLNFEEFEQFYADLRKRPEIEELFFQYSSDKIHLLKGELLTFLQYEQSKKATESDAEEVIKKYANGEAFLTCDEFISYITSLENDIFDPKKKAMYQNMQQPLTHYFIESSHNTYLTGDQLKSDSSVEMYKWCLLSGCRCVELDCWDGSDGEPIIYHGHTLTSKIKFAEVIAAIKEYAFKASPYPVILSLEVHCGHAQQERMAEIMVDVFGDMLAQSLVGSSIEFLPSPQELEYKILLKGKTQTPAGWLKGEEATGEEEEDEESDEEEEEESEKKKGPKPKIAEKLSDLIFFKAVKFKSFAKSAERALPYEMSSFSERKTAKLIKNGGAKDFVKYNMRQCSRIYPKGIRFDSSNYDPVPAWNAGCQIVALNYQTGDINMWTNQGKFLENGKCGYVLKPERMRNPEVVKTGIPPIKLSLTIVSGSQLPKPDNSDKGEIIDPYVVAEITGNESDNQKQKTKVISDNGFNPIWQEKFDFSIADPETAFLRLAVWDEDVGKDDFIGQFVVPISCMRSGCRVVHLRTKHGDPIACSNIFVKVQVR